MPRILNFAFDILKMSVNEVLLRVQISVTSG